MRVRLPQAGLRTSKERVRRLMRENGLQATAQTGHPRGPRAHDGTIIPETIDTMWGADMTAAFTVEHGHVTRFVAVDHASPSASVSTRSCTAPVTRRWSRSGRTSSTAAAAPVDLVQWLWGEFRVSVSAGGWPMLMAAMVVADDGTARGFFLDAGSVRRSTRLT